MCGCGTTKSYTATEQLLMSDAVDATVSQLDFSPLSHKKVYLDTTYVKTLKSPLLVDSDYVISSLRQQMLSAGVLLVDSREEADLIAESRIGALGMDGHTVTYGVPASNNLSTASNVFANTPSLPTIPELSFARREAKTGAAKIAVFAYERDSKEPYWQSGIARSASNAKDTWILGIGPWQRGTIYEGTRFAGSKIVGSRLLTDFSKGTEIEYRRSGAFTAYKGTKFFGPAPEEMSATQHASNDGETVETETPFSETPFSLTSGQQVSESDELPE